MKRKLSIILVLAMLLNMFGAFAMTGAAQETPQPPESLKVLIISSSFGKNAIWEMPGVAQELGIKDFHFANLFRTACQLDKHWELAQTGEGGYLYHESTDEVPTWKTKNNVPMIDGILKDDWDYIVLQQAAQQSAIASTYNNENKSLINLVNYVDQMKTNPDCKIAFNMVWSFKEGPIIAQSHMDDQESMYYATCDATWKHVLTNPQIDLVLPSGTGIQNARTSLIGNNFNVDTLHLNSLGETVSAYVWYRYLTNGASIDHSTYLPDEYADVKDSYLPPILEAANNAYIEPYRVIRSSYPPLDATPTPTPMPSTPPDADGKMIIPIIDDDFEDYNTIEDVSTNWTLNTKLVTVEPDVVTQQPYATLVTEGNNKYLSLPGGGTGAYFFDPVAVNYHGGRDYGRNAKLVLEFDGYMGTASGSKQSYFRLDGPEYTNEQGAIKRWTAVSIGRRGGGTMRYSNSIASGSSAFVIASGLPKFTKVKFVVNLTDDNGVWYDVSKPTVDIYYNDMTTPVEGGSGKAMINPFLHSIERFNVGGSCATMVDNVKLYITVDSDSVPKATPTSAPTATPVPDKTNLLATIEQAQALYDIASANVGDGAGQYSQAAVSALNSAINDAVYVSESEKAWQGLIDAKISFVEGKMAAVGVNTATPVPVATPTPVVTQTPDPSQPTSAPAVTTAPTPSTPIPQNGPYKVLWQEDFDNAKYDDTLTNATDSLKALGWETIGVPVAKISNVSGNKYLTVSCEDINKAVSPADHDGLYYRFGNVRVSGGTLSENDPGHPGTNAKLTVQYDTMYDLTGTNKNAYLYSALMAGEGGYDKNKVFGGIVSKNASYRYYPFTSSYQSTIGGVADCGNKSWVTLKMVINITDGDGNYVSTIDTYVKPKSASEFTYLSSTPLANITASYGVPVTAGRYYISWHNAGAATNVSVDNISMILTSDEITNDYNSSVTPEPATDKSALSDALDAGAERMAIAGSNVGNNYGQYSQTVVSALQAAIDNAYRVMDKTDATQEEIDEATDVLNQAIEATVPNTTSQTPVPVDKSALDDALTVAYELYDNASANVGDGSGEYSQALVSALLAAIEIAQEIYDDEEVDETEVNQAIADLNAVVATVVPNTATPTPEPTEEPTPEPTPEPTEPPVADVAYGDADGNGEVAVEDATAILRFKAGLLGETDINLYNADADGNGEVAVEDATAILRYKAGLLANLGPQTA